MDGKKAILCYFISLPLSNFHYHLTYWSVNGFPTLDPVLPDIKELLCVVGDHDADCGGEALPLAGHQVHTLPLTHLAGS